MSSVDKEKSLSKRQWAMLGILTLSSFIVVLDFSSIFIPLPTIMEEMNGTIAEGTWVITGFILMFAIFLLACSSFTDIYGERRLFLIGIMGFTLASIASALASSMEFLIGARVFLGIGAAMVEYTVYKLIKTAIPSTKQKLAFQVQGTAFIVGALLAPIISGAITTLFSWEYIFWLNVVVGIVVFLSALRVIPNTPLKEESPKLDVLGLLLGGGSLFLVFFVIIEGTRIEWNSPFILGFFAIAIVLFILFIIVERRVKNPMIDIDLFKDRLFGIGNILRGASEFTSMGIYFVISHLIQVQIGYSALFTGLLLMSVIVGGLVAGAVTEPLAKKVDGRWLIIPGFLIVAGGTFWLAHITPYTTWVFFIAPLVVTGAGFTAQESPTLNVRDKNVPSKKADSAWRISYSVFLIGIGLGVSVVSAIWQSQFISKIQDNLSQANLSSDVVDKTLSNLLNGGISGDPASSITGSSGAKEIIQMTFSNAANSALIGCVVVALLGGGIALFFSDNRE